MLSKVLFHLPLIIWGTYPACVPEILPKTSNEDLEYKMCNWICHHEFHTVHFSFLHTQGCRFGSEFSTLSPGPTLERIET